MKLEVKNSEYIEDLNWRYAVKKYDASKNLEEADLEALLTSVQLSASSYGLQPYEILVIKNKELREKLKEAAWNQTQITDAAYLIVFANYAEIHKSHISDYMDNISKTRNVDREDLKGMEEMIENTTLSRSIKDQQVWASKQTYIALGNLLSAAANMKIDATPMEGFDNEKFDEILGLKDKNLKSSVIATVGYRSEEDHNQFLSKVRKSKTDLFHYL